MLLDELALIQYGSLALIGLIAIVTLAGWLIGPVGVRLPSGWTLMKANTALVAGLSALSLSLSQPRRSRRSLLISRFLAVAVIVIAAISLLEYRFNFSLSIDTWLSADRTSAHPGRMSPQTAFSFSLLGMVMLGLRLRKRLASYAIDLALCVLCMLLLVIASGYMFGALHLIGFSTETRTSPQTLLCLVLLTFVAFGRRAEYGIFSILLGIGIGSKIARIACPCALLLPFVLGIGNAGIIHSGLLSAQYSTASATALAAMLAFSLILLLAWRINSLEQEVHDLSLRDELTGLYNRRGFYVLAEQALHLAERTRQPFSVLFLDLDNLKRINDGLGHDVGSLFLAEVADFLKGFFRQTDVVGRIGGDEFVVAVDFDEANVTAISARLEEEAVARNADPNRAYPFSFSVGHVTLDHGTDTTLEDLLDNADQAMYMTKRRKKMQED